MLKIGWASRDYTPQRPALLQGQMHIRIARDAADPLTLTALALDGGDPGAPAILVSIDHAYVPDGLMVEVRKRLQRRLPEFPPEALLMAATHTHDAPVLEARFYPQPAGDIMTAEETMLWLADRAADAAVEAWEKRTPRLLSRAFGHAVVGHNRRAVYTNGLALMYGKTNDPTFSHIEGYEDHSLDMLFVWEPDGRLAGVALDIPCPSQVEEHLNSFSADFWHDIRVELRQRLGRHLQVLPLCGAAGDQSPHFLLYGRQEEEMRRRRGLTERQEIAVRVADAVMRALTCTPPPSSDITLAHVFRRLSFAPRRITREERDWAEKELGAALKRGDQPDLWWPQMLRDVVKRFDGGKPMAAFQGEIHVLRIGDAVLATNPFELYMDFGLQIKARSPAAQTLVVQLACAPGLYLPTERAVRGGHYGAHPVVAPVGPEGGRELVEATLAAIGEVLAPAVLPRISVTETRLAREIAPRGPGSRDAPAGARGRSPRLSSGDLQR